MSCQTSPTAERGRGTRGVRSARRVAALLAALLVALLTATPARAADCPPAVDGWVDRCKAKVGSAMRASQCFAELLTVDVETAAGVLRVEISGSQERSFRHAGALGVSPVGEFANWNAVPRPMRTAFDGVVACVTDDPSVLAAARSTGGSGRRADDGDRPSSGTRTSPRPPSGGTGWLWPCGLALGAAACVSQSRRRAARMPGLRVAAALVAMAVAMAFVRRLAFPAAFLHQNGQGPLWIRAALGTTHEWPYGEGYRELFAFAAQAAHAAPEAGVFAMQSVLGAASVVAAWVVARTSSGSRPVAWAAAAVVGLDPGLARLSQSESYYGAWASFLLLAAALVAAGARGLAKDPRTALLAFCGAGLLVTQVARMHPVGWTAAALLPLVAVVQPGRRAAQLRAAGAAAFVVGALVLLFGGAALRGVMTGPLGQQWLGIAGRRMQGEPWTAAPFLGLALLLACSRSRPRRAVGALILALTTISATNLVSEHTAWIDRANLRLFAPILLAAVASLSTSVARARRRPHLASALLAVSCAGLAARDYTAFARLPTDVLEAEWARTWRHDVPGDRVVAYVERAGRRLSVLPLYPPPGPRRLVLTLSADDTAEVATLSEKLVYYRSSVCSTAEGRPACARIEAMLELSPIAQRTLPARPSMTGLDYDSPEVKVGLYDATRAAPPHPAPGRPAP